MAWRHMTCCVCGEDAGNWHQHWNRDTGWGICSSCAREQESRLDPKEMADLYGTPGINFAPAEAQSQA